MSKLTDKQIKNWRSVLFRMFGSAVFFMSDADIQKFRDKFQSDVDKLETTPEPKYCQCDTKKHGYTRHRDDTVTCNHCQKLRYS